MSRELGRLAVILCVAATTSAVGEGPPDELRLMHEAHIAERETAMRRQAARRAQWAYERERSRAHARLQSPAERSAAPFTHSSAHALLDASSKEASSLGLMCPVTVPEPRRHSPVEAIWRNSRPGDVPSSRHDANSLAISETRRGGQFSLAERLDDAHSPSPHPTPAGFGAPSPPVHVHSLPLLPAASQAGSGILRLVNRDSRAGIVELRAIDDSGRSFGPAAVSMPAGQTLELHSSDIEHGNPLKGLPEGLGTATSDWRLEVSSTLDLAVQAYATAPDGLRSALHDTVAPIHGEHRVPLFPGSAAVTEGRLRLVNANPTPAEVTIRGLDDRGTGGQLRLTLGPGTSRWLTASALETGAADLSGTFGIAADHWRLSVRSSAPIEVMPFSTGFGGELANLSSGRESFVSPASTLDTRTPTHAVWLFRESGPNRESILRLVNHSSQPGAVSITARDDSGKTYGPTTLAISSGAALSVTRSDLKHGNAETGLSALLDPGQGPWRLELRSDLDLQVGSYVAAANGTISPLHDLAPRRSAPNRHEIAWLPTDSGETTGLLRLVNRDATPVRLRITGTDEQGKASHGAALTLPGHGARTLATSDLQWGAAGLDGWLGAGAGHWRLSIWSDGPVEIMALQQSASGRIANVSSAQAEPTLRGAPSPVGDLNGDGKDDVLLRHVDGRWYYYPMNGRAPIESERGLVDLDTDLHWRLAGLGDFDGDGKDDVLLRHTDGSWHGYLMDGLTVRSSGGVDLPSDGDWTLAAIGDLDGDGKDEPVLRHSDGRWRLVPLSGLSVAASGGTELPITKNPKWEFAGLGDLNGDGNDDILLRHQDGRWHYYPMDGSKTLSGSGRVQLTASLAWRFMALGDMNSDGNDDVLLRHVSGRWSYHPMSGATILDGGGTIGMTANLQWGFVGLADFNSDGTDDVLLRHEDGRWFYYPWSEGAVLADRGSARLTADLAWSTTSPEPALDGTTDPDSGEADDSATAEQVFASSVSAQVVQAKCIACHVSGGQSANTRLVLVRSTAPDHVNTNRQIFEDYVRDVDDGANVILNKVQGASGHGGGSQLIAGSTEFESLRRFVALLGQPGTGGPSITPANLFDGVRTEPARSTLRRAALIFAGRNPTEAEYDAIKSGGLASMRATIRGLMQGPEFHEFLTRGANDRLLTEREDDVIIEDNGPPFVVFTNERYRRAVEAGDRFATGPWSHEWDVHWGARRAPLELIAHVAENDLPYTEILTAPYIMANPQAAHAYGATADFDTDSPHEFQPTEIEVYYRFCNGVETEFSLKFGFRVLDPGPCETDFPHVGVLNTKVFLQRYPTTATNRNRARSRWTYYHFLGFDIEASAARTTDADALADTDNPTLRNPACTTCHSVLDPIAGAFQDYGEEGHYRDRWGGMDALDRTYVDGWPIQVTIAASSWEERETFAVAVGTLEAGRQEVEVGPVWITQGDYDYYTRLEFDRVVLRDVAGEAVDTIELESTSASCGQHKTEQGARVWQPCIVAIDVPETGQYTFEATVFRQGKWWACPAGSDWDECDWSDRGPAAAQIGLRVADFYREGDTWYRGMRKPGLAGAEPHRDEDALAWLAKKIVRDPRFAESVVKFWWPAIMGREVEPPPQAAGDAAFAAQLLRANAQNLEVVRLARAFRRGIAGGKPHNLKDLLVEITLSKWFRAHSLEVGSRLQRAALAGAGARRLLTPEELARKTEALTGFRWGRRYDYGAKTGYETEDALTGGYRLLYGGIDSDGVIERATDMTSVMLAVAETHAAVSSCPIVLRELYLLDDGQRRLFDGIDVDVDPSTELGEAAVREKLVQLHRQLMGVEVGPKSRDVNTAFALFLRAWRERASSGSVSYHHGRSCTWWYDMDFFDGILEDAIVLRESKRTNASGEEETNYYYGYDLDLVYDFLGEVNPRDSGGMSAWIVTLAYLMTDYRYLYL